jgi:hypothetical protein
MRLFIVAAVAGLSLVFSAKCELLQRIPFQFQDGLIWVQVKLAGTRTPLNYLLDSGSSVTAIDLRTARAFRLRLGDPQSVEGVSGPSVAYRVSNFQAAVGDTYLPKSILAIDLGSISKRCHQPIDGILGLDFFRNRIVQINFASGMIGLLKSYHRDLANCDILPIKTYNDAICLPVRIGGNANQWMRLDTGCDSALEWAIRENKARGLSEPAFGLSGGSFQQVNATVQLGNHFFSNVNVGIHANQIFPGEDGLLGNGLLSKFCLTIDERNRRVIFAKERRPGITGYGQRLL